MFNHLNTYITSYPLTDQQHCNPVIHHSFPIFLPHVLGPGDIIRVKDDSHPPSHESSTSPRRPRELQTPSTPTQHLVNGATTSASSTSCCCSAAASTTSRTWGRLQTSVLFVYFASLCVSNLPSTPRPSTTRCNSIQLQPHLTLQPKAPRLQNSTQSSITSHSTCP